MTEELIIDSEISNTIEQTLLNLNAEPYYESDYICKFPVNVGARICIHRLLLLTACCTPEDRFIPIHPGRNSGVCKHGSACPCVIALAMIQWSNGRKGLSFDKEIERAISGCNFKHSRAEVEYIRGNVFEYLYNNHWESNAVEQAFSKVYTYYQFISKRNLRLDTIHVYSYRLDDNVCRALYKSDDKIFQFPVPFDPEQVGIKIPYGVPVHDPNTFVVSVGEASSDSVSNASVENKVTPKFYQEDPTHVDVWD
jgi:hypothetical protein